MKHVKHINEFFGLFISKVEKELEKYGIKNYIINNDGTIDVDDNVNLCVYNLIKLPFQFGKVTGNFYCYGNSLISLEGCPKEVGQTFNCSSNRLTNLIGGPQEVGGDYFCSYNKLESLEGCAGDIGKNLYCYSNNLTSLDCSSVINRNIYCVGNNFEEEPEFYGVCDGKIIW